MKQEVDVTGWSGKDSVRCDHSDPENDCPFSFSDASDRIQNYGCLPTPRQIMRLRAECGVMWACHNDVTKPCVGAIRALRKAGLPYKYEGPHTLVTELELEQYEHVLD